MLTRRNTTQMFALKGTFVKFKNNSAAQSGSSPHRSTRKARAKSTRKLIDALNSGWPESARSGDARITANATPATH